MSRSIRLGLAGTVLAILTAGCGETTALERDVSVVLTPDESTATAGAQVSFQFDVRGSALVGVIFDYGDLVVDSLDLHGVTEANGTRFHIFDAPGSFQVAATAVDAVVGRASDTISVTVTP